MKKLSIADGLDLPLDAVTRRLAWMGSTGSGKTFGCKRMVEQMLRAGAQVVILDGMGVWPGLRLGKQPFDIPVFGGLYGDIPLEPTGGALVADVIVDRGTSIVLDVSQMLDSERTRFATAFAQRFFQRKKAAPSAVHLVLEECQDFVPENNQHGEERMLHEFQRIAKQGRTFGIGVSFISQRPQEVSKKALNQAECVFAFAMSGTQERKALQYWLSDKGFDGKLSEALPYLEIGAPHVWSPIWLKVSKVVRILPIESLDTSSTPKVGEKAFALRKLEPIDLKELTAAMAETVERAKLDDPKLLRARIAELEKALTKKVPAATTKVVERVEVPVFDKAAFAAFRTSLLEQFGTAKGNAVELMNGYQMAAIKAEKRPAPILPKAAHPESGHTPKVARPVGNHDAHFSQPRTTPSHTNPTEYRPKANGKLTLDRRVLTVLAQYQGKGMTRDRLALHLGMHPNTKTLVNTLGALRSSGWVEGFEITSGGLDALGSYEPLPTGAELFEFWCKKLRPAEERILRALSERDDWARDELAASLDFHPNTKTFVNTIGKLRGLGVVDGLRLSGELIG